MVEEGPRPLNAGHVLTGVQVSAWDEGNATHQEDYDSARSYITAISEKIETPAEDCEGHAKFDAGEARMDSEWR